MDIYPVWNKLHTLQRRVITSLFPVNTVESSPGHHYPMAGETTTKTTQTTGHKNKDLWSFLFKLRVNLLHRSRPRRDGALCRS